jgi:acetyltransferase-like isoleucine patch superfamily enzyme
MTDINGKIILKIRDNRLLVLSVFSKLWMSIELSVKRIHYGSNVRFWGTACMVRFPGSTISIGDKCSFRSDKNSNLIGVNRKCILSTHSKNASLQLGSNCGLSGTAIGCKERIVLGNDVLCGANTLITDFDWHGVQPDKRRGYTGDSKEIIIGNNVFIGYGSVILKGVTIGDNSVIGANSVVTRNIPANVIAGGNPCKVIKALS